MAAEAKRIRALPSASPSQTRCAIYTRKSTEEGLEQDFNTLDAQRQAAEDLIKSRRLEGWSILPEHYDDGGFTGANTDRPALKQLLADVAAGKIDCIVVYKVDRLSRSILDFLKLMELLDKHQVAFVSVTQPFDTRTSAGRLLVNMLLMFAQFEREMISERTRDKMHAARRRGKWIGGNLVLGYDLAPAGRGLVVNTVESDQVRGIFRLYLELGSLTAVLDEIDQRGWRMKSWTTHEGQPRGGARFHKNTLHNLLTNVVYTGRIRFGGELYDGEQERIVDDETWNLVQQQLNRNGRKGGRNVPNKYGGLLKGLVRCESCGVRMTHTYTNKEKTIYRYYVCAVAHQHGWNKCPTRSISAPELEGAVVDQIRGFARQPAVLSEVLRCLEQDRKPNAPMAEPEQVQLALLKFDPLWEQLTVAERVKFLRELVSEVRFDGGSQTVTVGFRSEGIKELCQTPETSQ